MASAVAVTSYLVIEPPADDELIDIEQNPGDELEILKTREDGFLFVYSEKLELGYWVNPILIKIQKEIY